MNFDIEKHIIFECRSGSHAYGMATAESDEDFRGVAIPPKDLFFGFLHKFEQKTTNDPDRVIFDIRKFFMLAADCNPNIIDLIFMPEDCFIKTTPYWDMIVNQRDLFLSTKAKFKFSGYAISQLKRIKTHRGWLLNPPKGIPNRADFNLPISQNDYTKLKSSINKSKDIGLDTMKIFSKEIEALHKYHQAMKHWANYLDWKSGRNKVRRDLEAKFGFDTKHAAHLVRLLRMGYEILSTGKVNVKRPDAEELLAIRTHGIWTYDQLEEYANTMDASLTELYEKPNQILPRSVDKEKLDSLCVETINAFFTDKGNK